MAYGSGFRMLMLKALTIVCWKTMIPKVQGTGAIQDCWYPPVRAQRMEVGE